MARRPIDLTHHLNRTVASGGEADFPVALRPLFYDADLSYEPVGNRLAVVREDTGEALGVVSDRYTLLPHQKLLDAVTAALSSIEVGPVPQGVYLDRKGARMRALFKFPALAQPIHDRDTICPCIRIQNTYDGTSRVTVHIGAFRFVCTNLAVGGGGTFAGGFMAVHQGDIPIRDLAVQLVNYLVDFHSIVDLYREWSAQPVDADRWEEVLTALPKRPAREIRVTVDGQRSPTVFDAYNACTDHATHRMRSYHGAFDLLERINRAFQTHFPPSTN